VPSSRNIAQGPNNVANNDPAAFHAALTPGGSSQPGQTRLSSASDPLRIGLDVASNCALINQDGSPSERLFAVGPLTRAAFWEIIAIPDIRNQCAELAAHLVQSYCSVGQGPWQSVPETADQPIASQDFASQDIVSADT